MKEYIKTDQVNGTLIYMPPEVLGCKQFSYEADYYALGCLIYEMMTGRLLFTQKDQRKIKFEILSEKQLFVDQSQCKSEYSKKSLNFVNSCIKKKRELRLGYSGIGELKNHSWFTDFDWKALEQKQVQLPFVPNVQNDCIVNPLKIKLLQKQNKKFIKSDMGFSNKKIGIIGDKFEYFNYNDKIIQMNQKVNQVICQTTIEKIQPPIKDKEFYFKTKKLKTFKDRKNISII